MNIKRKLPLAEMLTLIGSGPTTIMTSYFEGNYNLMACAGVAPVNPLRSLLVAAIHRNSLTFRLVSHSSEFALNIPSIDLIDEVQMCGTLSGLHVDKVKETGLTLFPGRVVRAPLISECIGHIECKVIECYPMEEYSMFVGKVVSICADDDAFTDSSLATNGKWQTLHYISRGRYLITNKVLTSDWRQF